MNQQQITAVASLCIKHQITDVRDFFKDLAAWDSTKLQKEWGKPASVPTIVWLAQNCKTLNEKQMLQALAKLEIERDVLFKHVSKVDSEITTQMKAATAKPSLTASLAKNRFAPAVVSTNSSSTNSSSTSSTNLSSTNLSSVVKPTYQTFTQFLQDPSKLAFVFEPTIAPSENVLSYGVNMFPTTQKSSTNEYQIYKRLTACDSEYWQIHDQLLNHEGEKEASSGNKRARNTNTKGGKAEIGNQSFVKKVKVNHSFVKH